MKRILTILAATLLLTAAMAGTASASSYDSVAEELSAIGVFRGTAGGFELDRAPKRSEAAIMLVRLYGAEEEAAAAYQSGEISHPFKDVGPIASPYVAWLYTKGITKGATATTFNSNAACTDKNYVVFLLRALGYSSVTNTDLSDTLDRAVSAGLINSKESAALAKVSFLRAELVYLSFRSLDATVSGTMDTLSDTLIAKGVFTSAEAREGRALVSARRLG